MSKIPKLVKAYKNPAFLGSDAARSVRILCEYLEPLERFKKNRVNRSVIFFGSARTQPGGKPDYYAQAAELAEKLARWTIKAHTPAQRLHVCTGGGPGIMQAAHEGAARVDKRLNVGLGISLPFEQHGNPYVESARALEFHYFFMRKFWFLNLASAAVIFPGGFGTFDELFELLTLTQTGKSSPMPIILYGREFWSRVVNFSALAEAGLISPQDLHLYQYADSADEALRLLKKGLTAS